MLMSTTITLSCLIFIGVVVAFYQISAFRADLLARGVALAEITAANASAALAFDDADAAQQLLSNLASASEVATAELFRSDDMLFSEAAQASVGKLSAFASFRRLRVPSDARVPLQGVGEHWQVQGLRERLFIVREVKAQAQVVGKLRLEINLNAIQDMIQRLSALVFGLIIASLVGAYWLTRLLRGLMTRQVNELLATAAQVAASNDYTLRARVLSQDEIGELTQSFNTMLAQVQRHGAAQESIDAQLRALNETLESRIEARTIQLHERNQALNEALAKLTHTQTQLVQSEKLAALGGLVAGVAHEINTPLGIAVTAASGMEEESRLITQKLQSQSLTASQLQHYIEYVGQGAQLTLKNLHRAAELVRSFKQVAVDQSSEQRREIELAEYIQQVLTSLHPALKRTQHQIHLSCPDHLRLDTYPGALYQILVNLVMNSLVHGFEGIAAGEIRIDVHSRPLGIEIHYADNGRGMSIDVKRQIFDPFFTTKRGQGGSGLGMHITWNLATRVLQGTLTCQSEPGAGALFVLSLPWQLRDEQDLVGSVSN